MIRRTRAQIQPIGLDLGHDSIKMMQLAVVGESLAVVAAAKHPMDPAAAADPQRVAAAVRGMLKSGGFCGRSVVAALPREILHIKNLRLPTMSAAELASAVRFEARNVFPFDTAKAHVDFLPAGEVRQGADTRQEVIVLAAKHEAIDAHVDRLHAAGLVVDSLDAEPCALFRGVERFVRRREDEQEVYVLVDVGLRRSQVVIGKGREISFYKPIDIGGQKLHEAVSRKLGITTEEARALRHRLAGTAGEAGVTTGPDAGPTRDPVRQAVFDAVRGTMEELAREISLCLRYYSVTFRGHRPGKVRLVGGEASDPQLRAVLNGALTVPVEQGRPLLSVETSAMTHADRHGAVGEWATAMGLGLRRTAGRFPQGDGTSRGDAPRTAEVIDLSALGAEPPVAPVKAGGAEAEPPAGAPYATTRGAEVARA